MEDLYGLHSTNDDYPDKAPMSPENLIITAPFHPYGYNYNFGEIFHRDPEFRPCSLVASESTSGDMKILKQGDGDEHAFNEIKAKIASHPSYLKLLDAYIDYQKVGAPREIACLLEEIRREKDLFKQDEAVSMSIGVDPELDEFMETYCNVLMKYKTDLSRPYDEATTFLKKIETQLSNLCKDEDEDGCVSSESINEMQDSQQLLKTELLRRYGGHIHSLKQEFSKKKKKVKLPKEATQTMLEWWNVHFRWPYPTEADKIWLAETTGLDEKQINNWFINQRKRHWKPSHLLSMGRDHNLSPHA